MLQQIEAHGGIYTKDGTQQDLFVLFRDHGLNFVRLRLWHTPAEGANDLDQTLAMARRIRAAAALLDADYCEV